LKSNQWQHVAVTRSGSTFRLFINGVLDKTVTNAGSLYNHPDPLLIGAAGAQVSYAGGFQGYLSDVRIVRGVSLYNASFYPSLTALGASQTVGTTNYNSVLLVNGTNGGIVDQHGSVVLETVGNTQLNTSVKKYNNSSLYFDGTGDYLTMPSNQLMNFGTGDFTVEAWVYPNSLSSDWFIISASGTGGFFFGFSSTSTIGYGWGRAGTAWDYRVASTATAGTWQHVAVTRSGTSMRLFVNGTQVGVTQTISTAYDMSTTSTTVGSQGANYYLNGYVDDLRVTKGYARYTGNFTPPTALATK
jgi:hypothetical protein